MFKWRVLLLSVFLLSSLGSPKSSLADGCYIPAKAVKKMPEIPGQRAIIAWKDGTETLIISSALDSEAQELGWIIPVPNLPAEMKKVSPGALKTLNFCLQPKITHDLSQEARSVAFVAILGVLLVGIFQFKREWFASFSLLLLILMCGSALLLPASLDGGARATANASSVHVDKTARVGAYDIVVLRVEKAEDLDAWLSQHGFAALPQNALPIIADYAKDKWVFVAIKLTREEGGKSAPHPIKLVFESKEAVYPLKLTSLPGGNTFFELFVVAANRVSSALLETEFCDKFDRSQKGRDEEHVYGFEHYYSGADTGQDVGHPEACSLMWPGCILTKLTGEIAGREMTDDLRFTSLEYAPYQQHFFSQAGARFVAAMVFIALLGLFCFVMIIAFGKRLRETGGLYLRKSLLPATALVLLISIMVFIGLPKIGADETHVTHGYGRRSSAGELYYVIAEILKKDRGLLHLNEAQIAQHILAELAEWNEQYPIFGTSNRVSGGQIKIEDTPGNFTVEKNDDVLTIRIYDYVGTPLILKYPPEPSTEG